jgi:DNA-binding beta-propeller fold protein YncE
MKRIIYAIQLVLVSLLMWPGAPGIYAAPRQDVTVYLPVVWQEPAVINDAVSAITPVAAGSAAGFHTPMDATPDPDGNQIYFTALSAQGAGVFKAPVAGGTAVTLTVGAPLTMPVGLVVSTDGQTLYVADTGATLTATKAAASTAVTTSGAIFTLPSSGGNPVPIAATLHTAPRGLTLIQENNVDMIYFTGTAPEDGQPAVMKVPASGGELTVLEKGGQLVAPVGIAVNGAGVIYVADAGAAGNGLGTVFKFNPHHHLASNSHAERLADRVRLGSPAGITLTADESHLLVSALHTIGGTSQVLVINTTTRGQGIVNKVIGVNLASGGLHRAHNNNQMAWCGVTAGTGGQGAVFRVTLP